MKTPHIDNAFGGDEPALKAARGIYRDFDVTELEAINIVTAAKLDLHIIPKLLLGLRERTTDGKRSRKTRN